MPSFVRFARPVPILVAGAIAATGAMLLAQIEPGDRGIAPIDSTSSYEIDGVEVDVAGKDADTARLGGWRVAQRKGWRMLWSRVNGRPAAQAPGLPDSTLDAMVAGIVVENEQIGPRRYIARLGVLFDRARTGRYLGVQGRALRSPPMLVIPVMWSGGTGTSFELRNEWQRAWARFRPGGSPIDYVRPHGTGSDPLLLNMAQTGRRGRGWWRLLLDQYGAADIIVPEVTIERAWPGGPVTGSFVARHGPDRRIVETFTLRVETSEALPKMLDAGVQRIDAAYADALRFGGLVPDPSLVIEEPVDEAEDPLTEELFADGFGGATTVAYSVQVETPDAGSVIAAESSLRAVPGVRSADATSLAIGGVSVVRVAFEGDLATLALALQARGYQVSEASGGLRVRRIAPPVIAPPAIAPPMEPAPE